LREDAPAPDSGDEDAAKAVVVTSATAALEAGKARDARPAIFKPIHALIPLAAAGLVFVARAPLPPGPAVVATPGTTLVQMNEVDGLEQSIKLAQLSARDDAQRERL